MMRSAAAVLLLAFATSACTTANLFGPATEASAPEASAGWTERIGGFFFGGGSSRPQQQTGDPPPPDDILCPPVTVRQGAATLAVYGPGEETPLNLRFQGTIGQMARDCRLVGKTMQMRVGVEGRVILGPAGGPAKLELPLRFAVVRDGPKPQTILTTTYRVPVAIGPGTPHVPFVQIDDTVTFPLPSARELDAYVVYVGFDPEILKRPQPRRPRA
jgi:hypothetical protein